MEVQPFNRLFVEQYQGVFRMLYRLTGEQQEAEDIAQEAFLKLHDHFGTIEEGKHKAWVYQVASNLGLNALRGRKRTNRWTNLFAREQDWETPSPDPAKTMHVRRTLSKLPNRQAQLLMLYAAGLSRNEMAQAIEVQPSSLGQLLLRAKRAFEKDYTSSGPMK